MNTRIGYRYTDRTDCRKYTSVVVAGIITWEDIQPYLLDMSSFIPGQIGLEDLQYRFALPGKDHPWHQIKDTDIMPTETAPTIALTSEQLIERFAHAQWEVNWNRVPVAPQPASQEPDQSAIRATPVRKRRFSAKLS